MNNFVDFVALPPSKSTKANGEMCRTPNTRSTVKRHAATSTPNAKMASMVGEESPTLSQDCTTVTWKWNSENTPLRSKARADRMSKQSPMHRNLYKRKSTACTEVTATDKPKGIFAFLEELRKLDDDVDDKDTCDKSNVNDNTEIRLPSSSSNSANRNETTIRNNEEIDNKMDVSDGIVVKPTAMDNCHLSESLKNDLFNDSSDQILVSCAETVERKLSQEQIAITQKSCNEIQVKPSQCANLWADESIDDILGGIDDSVLMQCTTPKNSKLSRHKSMPQNTPKAPPKPQTSTSTAQQKPSPKQQPTTSSSSMSRKSFTRHESMPVATTVADAVQNRKLRMISIRFSVDLLNKYISNSSDGPATQCTMQEIAEKRRIALERLRQKQKTQKK